MGLFSSLFKKNYVVNDTKKDNEESNRYQTTNTYRQDLDESAKLLLYSPYYNDNKDLFYWLACQKQPVYKIEMLLKSVELGHKIETNYVNESIEIDYPYFWENEDERDQCFLRENVLAVRGFADAMLRVALLYKNSDPENGNPLKLKYWQDRLLKKAENGDYYVQAALCNIGHLAFSDDDKIRFKKRYEDNIKKLANEGNLSAMLAVGRFFTPFGSEEKINIFTKVANNGSSDACYWLGKEYFNKLLYDENMNIRRWMDVVPKEIQNQMLLKEYQCYLLGAQYNKGVLAGLCQYEVAKIYEEGAYFGEYIPKDLNKAKYWYTMAYNNGIEWAKSYIN